MRFASLELQLAKSGAPAQPVNSEAERRENIHKLKTEYIRQTLLRDLRIREVKTAKKFSDLANARFQAGQVTKLDAFNAEVRLKSCEARLLPIERLRHEAATDLREAAGAEAEKLMIVPELDFGHGRELAGNDTILKILESDAAMGKVRLVTRQGTNMLAAKTLFEATRIASAATAKAVENSPEATRKQFRRRVESLVGVLNETESDVLLKAALIENAKRAVEATQICYERGLKDSFDVAAAEDSLMVAEVDFVNRKTDYELVHEQIQSLLERGR